ncbi:MAG: sensor histidine kinase [Acidimicrobiales bacterium]
MDPSIALASDAELLAPLRLTMVRVALTLGWVSAAVVLVGSLSPSWHAVPVDHIVILTLVAVAASVNGALGLMPWRRWMGTPRAEAILVVWAAGVVVLISVFVYLGGRWAGDYYLLYFLVVPFIAATEPLARQAVLYVVALAGFLLATVAAGGPYPRSDLAVRLVVLAGACVVSGALAQAIGQTTRARARAEASARLERALADEAHHRIKNNLQLIADLLSMEAAKGGSRLEDVVAETLSRIQSVAAVHQVLATAGEGRVALRPVVDRIVGLLADRLGGSRQVLVSGGEGTEVAGRRATWAALVVNELVTNALRHGRGAVTVGLEGRGSEIALLVADEGPGPGDAPTGLGLALVARLVEDGLGGRIVPAPLLGGWEVAVRFPREDGMPAAGGGPLPSEAREEMAGAGAHRRG